MLYNRIMGRGFEIVCVVTAMLASCTKPNPAATCSDGACTDPAFPFCDVDGSVGGTAGACISVTCTPGAVAECRGSDALVCSATGDDYTDSPCAFGCDPAAGCLACTPGQAVCTNGTLDVCDAAGDETMTACPLGCFGSDARCTDIDPSNGLGVYLDMVTNPPDLTISGIATVDSDAGTIVVEPSGDMLTAPNFVAPAANDGPAIRVFVVHNLEIESTMVARGSLPIAFLASGDISIDAPITSQAGARSDCDGGSAVDLGDNPDYAAASGGGGNASRGGAGGGLTGDQSIAGGAGGGVHGTATLTPLLGGCAGGGIAVFDDAALSYAGGGGGARSSSAAPEPSKSTRT